MLRNNQAKWQIQNLQYDAEKDSIIIFEKPKEANERNIEVFEKQCDKNLISWNIFIHTLFSFRGKLIKSIVNVVTDIRRQIKETKQAILQLKNKIPKIENLKLENEKYLQNFTNLQTMQFNKQIQKQFFSFDTLIQIIQSLNLSNENCENKLEYNINQFQQFELKINRFQYELLPQSSSILETDSCNSIVINIIIGCDNSIKIFDFIQTKLKLIQELKGHQKNVFCLQLLKDGIISGGYENKINIWELNDQNEWLNTQTLEEHSETLVSGSRDEQIMFWGLHKNQWLIQQKLESQGVVLSLSFNDSSTNLISSILNKYIAIFMQKENQWVIFQKISIEIEAVRNCFINEEMFAFLPWKGNQLHIYNYFFENNECKKIKNVDVQSNGNYDGYRFPVQFIKSKNNHEEFILDQSIEFQFNLVYGQVSEDGNFLITWEKETLQIQIRELKLIQ